MIMIILRCSPTLTILRPTCQFHMMVMKPTSQSHFHMLNSTTTLKAIMTMAMMTMAGRLMNVSLNMRTRIVRKLMLQRKKAGRGKKVKAFLIQRTRRISSLWKVL